MLNSIVTYAVFQKIECHNYFSMGSNQMKNNFEINRFIHFFVEPFWGWLMTLPFIHCDKWVLLKLISICYDIHPGNVNYKTGCTFHLQLQKKKTQRDTISAMCSVLSEYTILWLNESNLILFRAWTVKTITENSSCEFYFMHLDLMWRTHCWVTTVTRFYNSTPKI